MLTHSPTLHTKQQAGFDQTLGKATTRRLAELAETLTRGKTRREKAAVEREITRICRDSGVKRVVSPTLTGDTPAEHRLTFTIDEDARAALRSPDRLRVS